jgi:ABC-type bacteriocin/lantibiotic exporter with double-glycine peptidase domain
MMRDRSTVLAAALAALCCAGCVSFPGTTESTSLEDLRADEGWVLLDSVPFVPQASDQDCGAACLAMVLGHWGIEATAESLEAECAAPFEEGLRAGALRDAAKRRGLQAYVFSGGLADIQHELACGRPVIVGMYKPAPVGVTSHFEVVVGLHPWKHRVAVLDPTGGLMCDSITGFAREWQPTRSVTLVVFRPAGITAPPTVGARTLKP